MIHSDDGVLYSAWDGQVEFIIEPYVNMLSYITFEQIRAAIPDYLSFGNIEGAAFDDFCEFTAATIDIRFHLKDDAPPMLKRLEVYWAGRTRNWVEDWQAFIRTHNLDIRTEWWKALNSVTNPAIAAPAALATPLPDGEALDNLPDDSPLSKPGKGLNARSFKSSTRKRKQTEARTQ